MTMEAAGAGKVLSAYTCFIALFQPLLSPAWRYPMKSSMTVSLEQHRYAYVELLAVDGGVVAD